MKEVVNSTIIWGPLQLVFPIINFFKLHSYECQSLFANKNLVNFQNSIVPHKMEFKIYYLKMTLKLLRITVIINMKYLKGFKKLFDSNTEGDICYSKKYYKLQNLIL